MIVWFFQFYITNKWWRKHFNPSVSISQCMLFSPASRTDQRFFCSYFSLTMVKREEKNRKGRSEKIIQQVCDYLGTWSHWIFMSPYTMTTWLYTSAESQLLQHTANHAVENSAVCLCRQHREKIAPHLILQLLQHSFFWLHGLTVTGGQFAKREMRN